MQFNPGKVLKLSFAILCKILSAHCVIGNLLQIVATPTPGTGTDAPPEVAVIVVAAGPASLPPGAVSATAVPSPLPTRATPQKLEDAIGKNALPILALTNSQNQNRPKIAKCILEFMLDGIS